MFPKRMFLCAPCIFQTPNKKSNMVGGAGEGISSLKILIFVEAIIYMKK